MFLCADSSPFSVAVIVVTEVVDAGATQRNLLLLTKRTSIAGTAPKTQLEFREGFMPVPKIVTMLPPAALITEGSMVFIWTSFSGRNETPELEKFRSNPSTSTGVSQAISAGKEQ